MVSLFNNLEEESLVDTVSKINLLQNLLELSSQNNVLVLANLEQKYLGDKNIAQALKGNTIKLIAYEYYLESLEPQLTSLYRELSFNDALYYSLVQPMLATMLNWLYLIPSSLERSFNYPNGMVIEYLNSTLNLLRFYLGSLTNDGSPLNALNTIAYKLQCFVIMSLKFATRVLSSLEIKSYDGKVFNALQSSLYPWLSQQVEQKAYISFAKNKFLRYEEFSPLLLRQLIPPATLSFLDTILPNWQSSINNTLTYVDKLHPLAVAVEKTAKLALEYDLEYKKKRNDFYALQQEQDFAEQPYLAYLHNLDFASLPQPNILAAIVKAWLSLQNLNNQEHLSSTNLIQQSQSLLTKFLSQEIMNSDYWQFELASLKNYFLNTEYRKQVNRQTQQTFNSDSNVNSNFNSSTIFPNPEWTNPSFNDEDKPREEATLTPEVKAVDLEVATGKSGTAARKEELKSSSLPVKKSVPVPLTTKLTAEAEQSNQSVLASPILLSKASASLTSLALGNLAAATEAAPESKTLAELDLEADVLEADFLEEEQLSEPREDLELINEQSYIQIELDNQQARIASKENKTAFFSYKTLAASNEEPESTGITNLVLEEDTYIELRSQNPSSAPSTSPVPVSVHSNVQALFQHEASIKEAFAEDSNLERLHNLPLLSAEQQAKLRLGKAANNLEESMIPEPHNVSTTSIASSIFGAAAEKADTKKVPRKTVTTTKKSRSKKSSPAADTPSFFF